MRLIYAEKGNVYVYEQTYRSLRKDLLTGNRKERKRQEKDKKWRSPPQGVPAPSALALASLPLMELRSKRAKRSGWLE